MILIEEGEQIVKVVRRHWLVLMPMVFTLVISALAPLFLYRLFLSDFLPFDAIMKDAIIQFFSHIKAFGYSLWLLILWVSFFVEWTDYYLDLWIITDRRIIDVEQKGFFHRSVTSFNFEQIQDITVVTRGFIETFLKFGTLHIQTAGHDVEIVIRDAHNPEEARSLILQLQNKAQKIR